MSQEEVRWIKGLKRGNDHAFAEFFNTYRGKIYHLALKIMSDPTEAEEVVQEVMFTVFRRVDSFQGNSRLSTWVYRVTVNAALMRLRAKKRETHLDLEAALCELEDSTGARRQTAEDWSRFQSLAEPPERELSRKELGEQIRLALAEMDPNKRRTFLLKNLYGFSDQELSLLMRISIPALKSQLYRSRNFLRKRLQEYVQLNLAA